MTFSTSSGELRLNWQRRDVGRITRVSGETTARGLSQAHALLDKLYRKGHIDVLVALRDGQLTMRQLRQLDRSKKIDWDTENLGEAMNGLQPFWPTVERMLPKMGKSVSTRRRYAFSFEKLAAASEQLKYVTIEGLTTVDWEALQAAWENGAVDWNMMRTAISRLLTLTLGNVHHPIRRRVMEVLPRAQTVERVSVLTMEGLTEILPLMEPELRPAILTLAVTGMRVGELYACTPEHLVTAGNVVLITVPTITDKVRRQRGAHKDASTKTGGRAVVVDIAFLDTIKASIPLPVTYKLLYRAFKRAAKQVGISQATLHDLRHLHGAEVTEATSIAISQQSLGHKTAGMTIRYSKRQDLTRSAVAVAARFSNLT